MYLCKYIWKFVIHFYCGIEVYYSVVCDENGDRLIYYTGLQNIFSILFLETELF